MGQKRNLLEKCPLTGMDSTKRIEIYDDKKALETAQGKGTPDRSSAVASVAVVGDLE